MEFVLVLLALSILVSLGTNHYQNKSIRTHQKTIELQTQAIESLIEVDEIQSRRIDGIHADVMMLIRTNQERIR